MSVDLVCGLEWKRYRNEKNKIQTEALQVKEQLLLKHTAAKQTQRKPDFKLAHRAAQNTLK